MLTAVSFSCLTMQDGCPAKYIAETINRSRSFPDLKKQTSKIRQLIVLTEFSLIQSLSRTSNRNAFYSYSYSCGYWRHILTFSSLA